MWKFIVDVVDDCGSSLRPDVGRGFLHVSNVFLFKLFPNGDQNGPYRTVLNKNSEKYKATIKKPLDLLCKKVTIEMPLNLAYRWPTYKRSVFTALA